MGKLKHGMHGHPMYWAWTAMRDRCNNPNGNNYVNYGGRGIKVCARWDDFALFVQDMGERPPGMSLDRIDNDGDYTPENCRWATPETQSRNRRAYKAQTVGRGTSKHVGVGWDKRTQKWEARVRHEGREKHLGRFDNEDDAAEAVRVFRASVS